MADDLRGRLDILKEIEQADARIDRARQSSVLTQLKINKYVDEQKKKVGELGKELKKVNQTRLEGLADEESGLSSMGSLYSDITKLEKERLNFMVDAKGLTAQQEVAVSKMASLNQKIAKLGRGDNIQRASLLEKYGIQEKIAEGIGGENKELVDNLAQQNVMASSLANLTEKQKVFLQKQKDIYAGIKDTIGGILETASLLSSTVGGVLGGALIGAGMAGKELLHTMHDFGGSIGKTNLIATNLFGKVLGTDAVGAMKGLSKEFGGLSDTSLKTQFRTNVIAKNLNLSTSEAASLTGQFARLNDGSTETAQNLIDSTRSLAEQNGLVPTDLMADVANSAEQFALFGKDGGKNILKLQ